RSGKPCMTPNRPLPARRLPGLLLVLLAWLAPFAGAHAAIDESELLPVDQAFVLTATAPEPGRIEVHWKIAEGYYLYRHRTSVSASGGFIGGNLRLPAGRRAPRGRVLRPGRDRPRQPGRQPRGPAHRDDGHGRPADPLPGLRGRRHLLSAADPPGPGAPAWRRAGRDAPVRQPRTRAAGRGARRRGRRAAGEPGLRSGRRGRWGQPPARTPAAGRDR